MGVKRKAAAAILILLLFLGSLWLCEYVINVEPITLYLICCWKHILLIRHSEKWWHNFFSEAMIVFNLEFLLRYFQLWFGFKKSFIITDQKIFLLSSLRTTKKLKDSKHFVTKLKLWSCDLFLSFRLSSAFHLCFPIKTLLGRLGLGSQSLAATLQFSLIVAL